MSFSDKAGAFVSSSRSLFPDLVAMIAAGVPQAVDSAIEAMLQLSADGVCKVSATWSRVESGRNNEQITRRKANTGLHTIDCTSQTRLAAANAIPHLVFVVLHGPAEARGKAAGVLWNLSVDDSNRIVIAEQGKWRRESGGVKERESRGVKERESRGVKERESRGVNKRERRRVNKRERRRVNKRERRRVNKRERRRVNKRERRRVNKRAVSVSPRRPSVSKRINPPPLDFFPSFPSLSSFACPGGAIRGLLQLLAPSQPRSHRREAAGALWNLALDQFNRRLIAQLGGVERLIRLAQMQHEHGSKASASEEETEDVNGDDSGSDAGVYALAALTNLALDSVHRDKMERSKGEWWRWWRWWRW